MAKRAKTKIGRPRKPTQWQKIEQLCAAQATLDEIAAKLGVSPDTIVRRVRERYDMTFADYFAARRLAGYASLRGRRYELAIGGNIPLIMHLSKHWFGEVDRQKTEISGPEGSPIAFTDADREAMERKLASVAAAGSAAGVPGQPDGSGAGGTQA